MKICTSMGRHHIFKETLKLVLMHVEMHVHRINAHIGKLIVSHEVEHAGSRDHSRGAERGDGRKAVAARVGNDEAQVPGTPGES